MCRIIIEMIGGIGGRISQLGPFQHPIFQIDSAAIGIENNLSPRISVLREELNDTKPKHVVGQSLEIHVFAPESLTPIP